MLELRKIIPKSKFIIAIKRFNFPCIEDQTLTGNGFLWLTEPSGDAGDREA